MAELTTGNKVTEKPNGEVASLINEVGHLVDVLTDNITTLEEKIHPVLRQEPSESQADVHDPVMKTMHGDSLVTILRKLHQANSRVVDLRERSEV